MVSRPEWYAGTTSGSCFRGPTGGRCTKKPVSRLLSTDFIAVDQSLSLEEVSRRVTGQGEQDLQQDFVITQDGTYLGMGHLRDLLRGITELKIRTARYANPLTLLPGNVPINEELDRLLDSTCDFHVACFDLNHFKAYNDRYGYARGDRVIRHLGRSSSATPAAPTPSWVMLAAMISW
ncbi:diguanylate cyclase domain-containing protein [Marinobacterium aestuariivivens]|uniref:Diguanylate cyclase domain-containing protein n=1 Tax=Marinobacterium aestuariivivens TaxID=1698799 RepID=A0ABW1ZY28_9GAMM